MSNHTDADNKRDAFGKELEVGQPIIHAWASSGSVHFVRMWVIGFTDKMVRVSRQRDAKDGTLVRGWNCVIMGDVDEAS